MRHFVNSPGCTTQPTPLASGALPSHTGPDGVQEAGVQGAWSDADLAHVVEPAPQGGFLVHLVEDDEWPCTQAPQTRTHLDSTGALKLGNNLTSDVPDL